MVCSSVLKHKASPQRRLLLNGDRWTKSARSYEERGSRLENPSSHRKARLSGRSRPPLAEVRGWSPGVEHARKREYRLHRHASIFETLKKLSRWRFSLPKR